jgi:hypothetical protein
VFGTGISGKDSIIYDFPGLQLCEGRERKPGAKKSFKYEV